MPIEGHRERVNHLLKKAIRDARRSQGLDETAAAELTGVPVDVYRLIEAHPTRVGLKVILRLMTEFKSPNRIFIAILGIDPSRLELKQAKGARESINPSVEIPANESNDFRH